MSYRYILEINDPITHRFSSAVRNEIDPTNATYPDDLGDSILYPVRLAIPKVNNKISDSISGASSLTQYTLEIENSDGKYDDVKSLGWFNIPVVLKRSNIDNPLLSDFVTIMKGELSYPVVTQSTVNLVINNLFRTLTQQSCNTFKIADYPNLPDNVIDKSIPIGYGDLINVPLSEVDTNTYIALDPDYITAVSSVYDQDDNSIAFTFNAGNGQITAIEGATADVTGRANNKIGSIITTEIEEKGLITYDSTNWDTVETNNFILSDSLVNFYFDGGSVRDLVNKVLKSDNAFLFTKNDGRLTLRQWARTYSIHTVATWQFMKFPKKDYQDAQRYFNSSVLLQYDKNISSGLYDNQVLINNDSLFNSPVRKTYPVDLYEQSEIDNLAIRLYSRFSLLSEIISLYVGKPTEDINLLDTIILDLNINGRQFSDKTTWIVREIDPGQDIITIESTLSAEDLGIHDGVLSQPYSNLINGILSQPMYNGLDGVPSQPLAVAI